MVWLIDCLTPFSTLLCYFVEVSLYWWRMPEYPESIKIGVKCTCPVRDSNSQPQCWLASNTSDHQTTGVPCYYVVYMLYFTILLFIYDLGVLEFICSVFLSRNVIILAISLILSYKREFWLAIKPGSIYHFF